MFEWDYRNRLTSVKRYLATPVGDSQQFTTPSGAEVTLSKAYTKHYVYNVYNQLVYEYMIMGDTPAVKDNETVYIVQGGQRVAVLEKTAGSYDVTHLLLPDPTSNRMWAEQYINGATSHTIWPLHDQQGTVIAAISDDWHDDQDDVQHFKYDAYGLLKFDTEQDPSLANRLVSLHAGRDWDEVSDLYYNNARWYDPSMQRFISQDPLGFAGGDTNLYRYCGNSPTNATDPSGKVVNVAAAGVGAGVGALVGGGGYLLNMHMTGGSFDGADFAVAMGAGAASGALAGFTFGGSLLVQGAAMGATYGALNSGGTTLVHGGSLGDAGYSALQGAAIGAAAGAMGGVVGGGVLGRLGTGFVGYTASGIAAGVSAGGLGGGLGGFMQTGTLAGAISGARTGALQGGILGGAAGMMVGGARYAAPVMESVFARAPDSVRNFVYTQIVGANLALRAPNMGYSRVTAALLGPRAAAYATTELCSTTLTTGTLARDVGLVLNEQIAGGVPVGYAGHHLISLHLAAKSTAMQRVMELGYNINRSNNGVALPMTVEEATATGLALHSGRHLTARHLGSADALVLRELSALDALYNAGHIHDANLPMKVWNVENRIRCALLDNRVRLQSNDPNWRP